MTVSILFLNMLLKIISELKGAYCQRGTYYKRGVWWNINSIVTDSAKSIPLLDKFNSY